MVSYYINNQIISEGLKTSDCQKKLSICLETNGFSFTIINETNKMFAFGDIDYHDKGSKNLMRGNYTWYNEQTGDALCTDSALIMDYSSGIDTLYVHADSIKLKSFNFGTDSLWRKMDAFFHVRAYRCDVQAVCDSLTFSTLSRVMTLHRDPIVWSDNRQVLGEQIDIHFNDSTIEAVSKFCNYPLTDNIKNISDEVQSFRIKTEKFQLVCNKTVLFPEMRGLRIAFIDCQAYRCFSCYLQICSSFLNDRRAGPLSLKVFIHHKESDKGGFRLRISVDQVHDGDQRFFLIETDIIFV